MAPRGAVFRPSGRGHESSAFSTGIAPASISSVTGPPSRSAPISRHERNSTPLRSSTLRHHQPLNFERLLDGVFVLVEPADTAHGAFAIDRHVRMPRLRRGARGECMMSHVHISLLFSTINVRTRGNAAWFGAGDYSFDRMIVATMSTHEQAIRIPVGADPTADSSMSSIDRSRTRLFSLTPSDQDSQFSHS